MKRLIIVPLLLFVYLMPAVAQEKPEQPDKTLSPYFFVQSDDPETDRLPLKSTSAAVTIVGVIADVTVTQVYTNEGKRPLEAIYTFPGSTRAAVYAMRMTIGDRVLEAKIEERQAARQQYEQARDRGQTASLLEQQRPNVFQMNVANIMPGDEIRVEMKYTELLVPESGTYEFMYPTVVGPRYSNQPDEPGHPDEWVKNPYLHQGEKPTYTFDLTVDISSGIPVKEVTSPSHKVNVAFDGPRWGTVRLDESEKHGGNRDFILRYRLAGDKVESGLMLYEGKDENFFLLMAEPPKRVKADQIPARDYVFVVDVSGSMRGFPLEISKKLLKDLIGSLKPTDTFNVLLFAASNSVMSPESIPATAENLQRAMDVIDRQRGGGGTELLPAMKRALALPASEGLSRSIVVVTDGYVHVERETFKLIRENLGSANLFAFGIGSSVNRYLIEGMARMGMGEPFVITEPKAAPAKADRFRTYIQSPVLTDIQFKTDGFEVYDVEPVSIPDVMAERPVIVYGKWKGKKDGTITLTGVSGKGRYKAGFNVKNVQARDDNRALRYLWARQRIAVLSDFAQFGENEVKEPVTKLGLTYSLLTRYTSFVAIDKRIRNEDGKVETVKQPLPLPAGVEDTAVGGYAARSRMQNMKKFALPTSPGPAREQMMVTAEAPTIDDSAGTPGTQIVPETPTCRLEKVVGLDFDAVEKALQQVEKDLMTCMKGSGLTVKLVVHIDENGKLKGIQFTGDNMDAEQKACLEKLLKKLKLPAGTSGSFILELTG